MRTPAIVICGDNELSLITARELADRYGQKITMVVPQSAADLIRRPGQIANVRLVESDELSVGSLEAAGIQSARALGVLRQDDLANFHAALRAQELNPGLRLVLDVFSSGLASRVQSFFSDCAALDDADEASRAFLLSYAI
jgi:Trk K+ transport system NAD-binding subunit